MKTPIGLALVLLSIPLFSSVRLRSSPPTDRLDGNGSVPTRSIPVIVELFTSEGCSSCPPADQLLARLETNQPVSGAQIIAMSEHVDYWNRLGWADPYSSSLFSDRQGDYARTFATDGPYTPQMVVDGQAEFIGSSTGQAQKAIADAARRPKADVQVEQVRADTPKPGELTLVVRIQEIKTSTPDDTAEILLAITESGLLSNVSRGENAGRTLTHTAVVRRLESIGTIEKGKATSTTIPAKIDPTWNADKLKAVVFVQERASRRILGAGSVALEAVPNDRLSDATRH